MKILLLSPRMPHPLGKADSMTVYRLIRYFAQRHEIYLACFYHEDTELKHLSELNKLCREVRCIKHNKWRPVFNMANHPRNSRLPLQVLYYLDPSMQKTVDEMLLRCKPDLAYAHLIRMVEYLKDLTGLPRVLAMQVSQTLNYRRMISNISSLAYRTLYRLEYNRVRKYEPEITRYFDSCLLISEKDKQALDGHEGMENIFYSPHGVDVDFYTNTNNAEKEDAILFCGVLETPTNMDAVLYFYNQIYPLVKKSIPDVRLYLVGKNPPRSIKSLSQKDPSVIVTGFVRDIRPYYARAKVGIDPLRIGAGLQNKLLIGMSMRQPMVCTSVANEGIQAEHGKEVIIADTSEEFASAVVELFNNTEKADRLANNARKYVEEKWTWEYHFQQLEKHFESLV